MPRPWSRIEHVQPPVLQAGDDRHRPVVLCVGMHDDVGCRLADREHDVVHRRRRDLVRIAKAPHDMAQQGEAVVPCGQRDAQRRSGHEVAHRAIGVGAMLGFFPVGAQ